MKDHVENKTHQLFVWYLLFCDSPHWLHGSLNTKLNTNKYTQGQEVTGLLTLCVL